MNPITSTVQRFYERFPYPGTGWQVRADAFPGLLLGYLDREPWPRTLQLLDAGCGTGAGLAAAAAMHPEARVVGVDLSAPALAAAARLAAEQGASPELLQADLLDEGVVERLRAASPGGFDLIWLSGVLHHVADPLALLRNLARLLAPDGLLSIMVYGRFGRMPVERLARAVELALPGQAPAERLGWARGLVSALEPGPILRPPFDDALRVGEPEFADRYLHPHAHSYTVDQLLGQLDRAGLRPLRWLEPRAWRAVDLLGPGEAADHIDALEPRLRWRVLEQLFDHPALELLACHDHRGGRAPVEDWAREAVDLNPQLTLRSARRRLGGASWQVSAELRLRAGPWEPLDPEDARVLQALRGPEPAGELAGRLGVDLDRVRILEEREWLFRPSP